MTHFDPETGDPYLLAMHFEKIAQELYTQLAQVSQDPLVRKLFAHLAGDEAGHHELFLRLRAATANPATFRAGARNRDAGKDRAMDLMRTHVLPVPATVSAVAMMGDRTKALELALRMEQDSILFYRGLMSVNPQHQGELARIVQQEQAHAQLLTKLLNALPAPAQSAAAPRALTE